MGVGVGVISKVNYPAIKTDSSLTTWPWSLATPHSCVVSLMVTWKEEGPKRKWDGGGEGGKGGEEATGGGGVWEGGLTGVGNTEGESARRGGGDGTEAA